MWNTRLNRGGHICHFSENVNHQWKTNGFGWWLRLIKKKKTWRHNWRVQKKRIWINDWASGGSLVGKSCLTLAASWTVSHQFPLSWNFQARILEYVVISFCRGSTRRSQNRTWSPTLQADSLPSESPGKTWEQG